MCRVLVERAAHGEMNEFLQIFNIPILLRKSSERAESKTHYNVNPIQAIHKPDLRREAQIGRVEITATAKQLVPNRPAPGGADRSGGNNCNCESVGPEPTSTGT